MAASQGYANTLAHGIDNAGDVGPVFELWAGSGEIRTDQGQAADGVAIRQFEVCMHTANGRITPLTQTGDYATGGYVVGGQPSAADTITVNGQVITFITSGVPTATQVLVGSTTADTAESIRDLINESPDLYGVAASGTGTTVTLTSLSQGTAGNSIATLEGVTSASFTVGGATLTGANAAEDVPSGNAFCFAGQAVPATTPGAFVPIYVSGDPNHEALIWPPGLSTLRARKMAFEGTMIVPKQLL